MSSKPTITAQLDPQADWSAKHDGGKPYARLLPGVGLLAGAQVLTHGAKKYAAHAWKTVPYAQERYEDALFRHVCDYLAGKRIDADSGLPVLAHIACNCLFLIEAMCAS